MSCSANFYRIEIPEDKISLSMRKKFRYKNGGIVAYLNDEKFTNVMDYISASTGGSIPEYVKLQKIRCGKCLDCRLNYSKEWAQRLVCESTLYENNWFVTLTYDDEHISENLVRTVSPWSHSLEFVPQLNKKDFTLFKKRLLETFRHNYNHTGIRFFMCGEYGEKNHRPHFHAILFNCPFPDLKLVKNVSLGGMNYCYYSSDILSKTWGKGFVMLGQVNWNTCSYVARYVMKKMKGDNFKEYKDLCDIEGVDIIQQEYVNMSRNPGIAREYFEHNFRDIYKVDAVTLPNGRSLKPARYFDQLYDIFSPEDLERVKSDRVNKATIREFNLHKGKTWFNVQEIEKKHSEILERNLTKLKRNL